MTTRRKSSLVSAAPERSWPSNATVACSPSEASRSGGDTIRTAWSISTCRRAAPLKPLVAESRT